MNRAVYSFCAALSPETTRHYEGTVRNFLFYLRNHYPDVKRLDQLERDPHILGWMAHLRARTPPLATASYINLLIALRSILNELAWTQQLPKLAHLLRREDLPRAPQRLPRPLTAEQDQLLQQEFLRRNDLGGNFFLLLRHTGMRIGEGIDLSYDCLRSTGPQQWAIHVPLGKLKTERMVPVDDFVCDVVQRLRFFRSLDPLPADRWLLARPGSKSVLLRLFRGYLHQVCHSLGLSTRIVPHQMRHTYATEMLRSGVSFPVLMKLLGHVDPDMTMRYVEIALTDLQREFHLTRNHAKYLVPQPKAASTPTRVDRTGVIHALLATQHVMEMFRRSLPPGKVRSCLDRLTNRLTKILAQIKKLPST
jgi:site-specific recombinase XerD